MDDIELSLSTWITLALGCLIILLGGCAGCSYVQPIYNVWHQQKAGEAELARAESNRRIAVLEAEAKMESSKSLANAEVIRAKGVAEANKIIGDSLKNNDGYLKYLWIQGMQTNQMQVVYVPTEANLPILEAERWNQVK